MRRTRLRICAGLAAAVLIAGSAPAVSAADMTVIESLSRSIKAPERTRRIVRQILTDTNDSYLTLWAADVESYEAEASGVESGTEASEVAGSAETRTPFEQRARNWEAFYRDADERVDYESLATECIAEVYPRYFTDDELVELDLFLKNSAKTRADITVFAATPLGRKYRAVLRRLSDETFLYLQHRVRSMIQSALKQEAV